MPFLNPPAMLRNPARPVVPCRVLCPSPVLGALQAVGLVVCLALPPGASAAEAPRAVLQERHRAVLLQHCESCHGAEKQKGKFRIDDLSFRIGDLPTAERWQKILNALNSGEMPPEEEKQLPTAAKTELLDDLSNVMVTARKALSDQRGFIVMRRLNRREYRNTLRDLLGVEVDVSELPSDTGGKNFDTVGANLFLTGNQFEQYEALGREALDEAFRRYASPRVPQKMRTEFEKTFPVVEKRNRESLRTVEQSKAWIQAVDAAVERPENAEIVAELRKIAATPDALRYHWKKIPGAPSPLDYGLDKGAEINPAIVYRSVNTTDFIRYDAYYFTLPRLDDGAYLTFPTGAGSSVITSVPGLSIPNDFPPGDYVVRIRVGAVANAPEDRRFLEFGLKGYQGGSTPALSAHHITGTLEEPQVLEIPYTFSRKNAERKHRNLFIREKGMGNPARISPRFQAAREKNGFGLEVSLWVDWMEIERKYPAEGELPPGLRALGIPFDTTASEVSSAELRSGLERFVREAYRGAEVPGGLLDRLAGIYETRRSLGAAHLEALREAMVSVLSSPRFLYRAEPDSGPTRRPLDGFELASRLSYFLWGGPPDATLRALAASGELKQPAVLAEQTERMLNDPRIEDFLKPFLTQWLVLERLDLFQFSPTLFPKFDEVTKAAARQEVFETFGHLLRENGRLGDALRADYAVVNALLADYYGIPGVAGDAFRKVALPAGSPRGGLLGMAATLAMGSNGERSNPVERGAWVLRKLLNEPPPPAPANVPEITRFAGKLLTTRERLQAHQENPQCANCHRKIDPIGFGLENFDAAGQWRTMDSYQAIGSDGKPVPGEVKRWEIEPAAAFHKGPAFSNYFQMREVIASREEAFARGFAAALVEYALGRPCGFSDELLLESLIEQTRPHGFGMRSFVRALVNSKEFHTR